MHDDSRGRKLQFTNHLGGPHSAIKPFGTCCLGQRNNFQNTSNALQKCSVSVYSVLTLSQALSRINTIQQPTRHEGCYGVARYQGACYGATVLRGARVLRRAAVLRGARVLATARCGVAGCYSTVALRCCAGLTYACSSAACVRLASIPAVQHLRGLPQPERPRPQHRHPPQQPHYHHPARQGRWGPPPPSGRESLRRDTRHRHRGI